MKQSEIYRQNAENCAYLAEHAPNEPTRQRYKRMEAAWRALADEQDWLVRSATPIAAQDFVEIKRPVGICLKKLFEPRDDRIMASATRCLRRLHRRGI
jgi:hypothetical protein